MATATKAQYTPGPWTQEDSDINATRYGRLELIASCYALAAEDGHLIESLNESPEVAANARLIAAAPEMLEALKRIAQGETLPEIKGVTDDPLLGLAQEVFGSAQKIARDTIAKAEGQ